MALMGAGTATGPQRLLRATQDAVSSPLLEGVGIDGAMGVLVNFRAGRNLGLRELQEAMEWLHERVHPDADIVFGSVIDEAMGEDVRATIVATGFHRPVRTLRAPPSGYVEPSGPLFAQRRVRTPMAAYESTLPRPRRR
jgi:cell division protein FtsZ